MTELIQDGELDRGTDPQYAAISPLAVVGLLVGLLGAAVYAALLIWNIAAAETLWAYQVLPPVGVIPMVGLVLSAVAYRRIRRSQGVLAGRGIALAGLVLGAAVTVVFWAVEVYGWHQERQVEAMLAARAYQIADDMAASRYDEVYALIPADFPQRQAADAQEFRRQFMPLFEGAGSLGKRELMSLQVAGKVEGCAVAPAEIRADLQHRGLDIVVWFRRAPGGTWELAGVSGAETFESQMKHPTENGPPPVNGPYIRQHEHRH